MDNSSYMMVFRRIYGFLPAIILVPAFTLTLFGCASNQVLHAVTESQEALSRVITTQSRQLEDQGLQLDMFAESQEELYDSVSELSGELARINKQLAAMQVPVSTASKQRPVKPVKPKKPLTPAVVDLSGKIVLGRSEWATLDILEATLEAELDTGVRRSVLYVSEIQKFERDGKEWVRFNLELPGAKTKEKVSFESPVSSHVRMRVGGVGDSPGTRPVIKVTITMGVVVEPAELVLAVSEKSPASLTLGRNFMRDIVVVDVARKFTQTQSK